MIKNLFNDYLRLSYTPGKLKMPDKDMKVVDYIILRLGNSGCEVLYLTTGNRLFIPYPWIDLFYEFSIHSGFRVSKYEIPEDNISKYIKEMLEIIEVLAGRVSNPDDSFLRHLGNIVEQNDIMNFRTWCKDNYNIVLEPLRLITKNINLDL